MLNRYIHIVIILFMALLIHGCGDNRASTSEILKENGVLGVVYSATLDSDGDGIPDNVDADVNGDGVIDNGVDSDGDGIKDSADADVNGDGTIDNGIDSDSDGINDANDIDDDNDGVVDTLDVNSTNPDSDGDGISDGVDVDMNGDGVNDNGVDSDGDGIKDSADADVNGDGVIDNGIDSDSDGINDANDIDDDNDGIVDAIEGTRDSDGDGINDSLESNLTDSDNDGVTDQEDSENNNPNNDSDGDGQANSIEITCGDAGDPLDSTKRCPWATETDEGKKLIESGFIYVPGGFDVDGDGVDEGGFWISRFQARKSGTIIPSETVIDNIGNVNQYISKEFKVLNRNIQVLSYNESSLTETDAKAGEELLFKESDIVGLDRVSNYEPYLALVCLSQYSLTDINGTKLDINITMPTMKQYIQVKMLLDADKALANGDGRHIRNGLLGVDLNIPLDTYEFIIDEFGETHKEYVRNIVQLRDPDGTDSFDFSKDVKSWWDANETKLKEFDSGATSGTDIGQGTGPESDMYGVVVRGGDILDVRISVTGTESDGDGDTNGISFRAATDYIY